MRLAQSKISAQGQISVPLEVRKLLDMGPGAVVMEWYDENGQLVVRRAGRTSSAQIRQVLFPEGTTPHASASEIKEGIRRLVRKRHARR
jgi:bifunctional DNA-binding transcriptional regulator/antitoxin component of YhaV-PrlF toxin-antitoxin module